MSKPLIESLEPRKHLALTASDVQTILAQAASQIKNPTGSLQAIVVTDREANVLGSITLGGLNRSSRKALRSEVLLLATLKARTAALFQSTENAFTTRTARFIIQDHFPQPINYTPGGPLYGVQFSNLVGSDIVGAGNSGNNIAPGIFGDPGGIPLFKDGVPVGGIGVAGDSNDVIARENLRPILQAAVPNAFALNKSRNVVFNGKEESDLDEQIALAGAQGFEAPDEIRANHIFLDGLRVPFTADKPASGQANESLSQLLGEDKVRVINNIISTPAVPFPAAQFAGISGFLKNTTRSDFGISASNDTKSGVLLDEQFRLTTADVKRIFADAAKQAMQTRAGIRKPTGVPAQVHIAVVDRDGDLLGVFKTSDGTNFSFDVAVQKARTAAFFSDNTHAFSSRAIGFMSQQFFPPGIDKEGDDTGPLYELQNDLSGGSDTPLTISSRFKGVGKNPLKNGITIFPGGVPLFKNGKLVGAVGISGDGVDQDDIIAFAGGRRFQPKKEIRSDYLAASDVTRFITGRVRLMADLFNIDASRVTRAQDLLTRTLDFRLPYVKFPRNPDV